MGNFGHLDYGSSILGQVVIPVSNTDGCLPFGTEMFDKKGQEALFQDKVALELAIILVDVGNCSVVTKVRNIEKVGGKVALIGKKQREDWDREQSTLPDDGSGHSINIASFLVSARASKAFKKTYS
mmetsp:Transcript_30258/g.40211  ORF Transcript_30258/g.40211 Transcript_30258/m.40211 type:complete len:126 (+) Transcript_30258:137-514(+)